MRDNVSSRARKRDKKGQKSQTLSLSLTNVKPREWSWYVVIERRRKSWERKKSFCFRATRKKNWHDWINFVEDIYVVVALS